MNRNPDFYNLMLDYAIEISEHIKSYFFTHWQHKYTIGEMSKFVLKCSQITDISLLGAYAWVFAHIMDDLHYDNSNSSEWDLEEIDDYVKELNDVHISKWMITDGYDFD